MNEPTPRDEGSPAAGAARPPGDASSGPDEPIHVLIVDDDHDLRKILTRGLGARGFRVVSAGDAEEALRIATAPDIPIDVIVMDLVLPDTWGSQLAMEQSLFRPDARIIFISGYSKGDAVLQATASREIEFLAKPFKVDELAELIRRVMRKE